MKPAHLSCRKQFRKSVGSAGVNVGAGRERLSIHRYRPVIERAGLAVYAGARNKSLAGLARPQSSDTFANHASEQRSTREGTARWPTSAIAAATLASIAAAAGVSLPTVSKVVNGRSDVAPETRARIERLLQQHRYLPPGRRRAGRAGLLDLVFNQLDSPWAIQILRGVEDYSAERADGVVISAVRHSDARPASWTSAVASHDTDGVILVTSEVTVDQWRQLHTKDIPLVVIDPVNAPGPEVPSVGATNWAGGISATEHLLELGHRRIARHLRPRPVPVQPGAGRRLPLRAGARGRRPT